ncbi:MAG: D-aminoacylase [Candidatus Roizmanbacteria bacterium]|nr:D-aminoacylase [Candidatus Roizmanbacteria bacterium]
MLDILIKHGTIVDGTGAPSFQADLGIADGRIAVVAGDLEQEATRTIDAHGLHVAPGFIDPHSHSDFPLLADPRAQSKIRQGVTTEVIGNCGETPAPLMGAAVEEVSDKAKTFGVAVTWRTMGEFLDRLRNPGTVLNVIPQVGHNNVRGSVIGYADVQPTPHQQAAMERLVEEAMEQGARGLSTGLYYPPGYYARTEEVIGLARAAARHGGIYTSHIRSESDLVLEAVKEAIEVGQKAGIAVEIAHLKVDGHRNWPNVDRLLALMDDAQAKGLRVGFDQYPYVAASTWLACILPYWAQAGGCRAVAERLRNPEVRARLERDWEENRADWDNRSGVRDWTGIVVSDSWNRPALLGKNMAQIAKEEGKDPLDTVFDLIAASEGLISGVFFTQDENIVRTLMRHPLVVIGSDGSSLNAEGALGQRKVHPRNYGTFPRVLGRYVREEQVLSLEEAVAKMTAGTAERFGLTDRGIVREGTWADLVLFDAQTVLDTATFDDPCQYPVGIAYVIVNGQVVLEQGQYTGVLAGRLL